MKKLLLATVATIALTAGSGWAAEPSAKDQSGTKAATETQGQAAGKAQTSGPSAEMKSESGADVKSTKDKKAGAQKKSDTGKKSDMGVKSGAVKKDSANTKSETMGADTKSGTEKKRGVSATQNRQTTGAGSDSKAGAKTKADTISKSSETTGSTAGTSVSLSPEQKTKIRSTVIESGKAPKIERSQINFSLNVGTVVPRSVHFVTLPSMLVEIRPAWRGYRYFVVGNEIVVVDPRTLRIVAILAV